MKYTRKGKKLIASKTSPSVPLPADIKPDKPGASRTSTGIGGLPTFGDAMTERVPSSILLVWARRSARVEWIFPEYFGNWVAKSTARL